MHVASIGHSRLGTNHHFSLPRPLAFVVDHLHRGVCDRHGGGQKANVLQNGQNRQKARVVNLMQTPPRAPERSRSSSGPSGVGIARRKATETQNSPVADTAVGRHVGENTSMGARWHLKVRVPVGKSLPRAFSRSAAAGPTTVSAPPAGEVPVALRSVNMTALS